MHVFSIGVQVGRALVVHWAGICIIRFLLPGPGIMAGKELVAVLRVVCSKCLQVSRNIGHSVSQDVCPSRLQFMHLNQSLSVSVKWAVRWSLLQVPHVLCWLHSAAKCLVVSN